MSYVTFATAGLLGIAAMSALAQAPPLYSAAEVQAGRDAGIRASLPRSDLASNIDGPSTRTVVAPTLPTPSVGENASSLSYIQSARDSLAVGRTGQAQQALEMAETRALDRSVAPEQAGRPNDSKLILQISSALQALGRGQRDRATRIIDEILVP